MALAECRECGERVSTEAATCPHCGCPEPVARPETAGDGPAHTLAPPAEGPAVPDSGAAPMVAGHVTADAESDPLSGAQPLTGFRMTDVASQESPQDFTPSASRASAVIALLLAGMLTDLIGVFSGLRQASLVAGILAGQPASQAAIQASDERQAFLGGVQLLLFLATSVAFLFWIHRAHRNLPSLGIEGLRFSPGWAVGWFFIPIYSLVRPYQVMQEIWKASSPQTGTVAPSEGEARAPSPTSWQGAPGSPLVTCWWGLFLVMSLVGRAVASLARDKDASSLPALSYTLAVSDIVSIAAAAVTIALVTAVQRRQTTKAALRRGGILAQPSGTRWSRRRAALVLVGLAAAAIVAAAAVTQVVDFVQRSDLAVLDEIAAATDRDMRARDAKYGATVDALHVETLLQPDAFSSQAARDEAANRVAALSSAIDDYERDAAEYLAGVEARVQRLDISQSARDSFLAQDAWTSPEAHDRIRESVMAERRSTAAIKAVHTFMQEQRGRYQVKGDTILFETNEQIAEYDRLVARATPSAGKSPKP